MPGVRKRPVETWMPHQRGRRRRTGRKIVRAYKQEVTGSSPVPPISSQGQSRNVGFIGLPPPQGSAAGLSRSRPIGLVPVVAAAARPRKHSMLLARVIAKLERGGAQLGVLRLTRALARSGV